MCVCVVSSACQGGKFGLVMVYCVACEMKHLFGSVPVRWLSGPVM